MTIVASNNITVSNVNDGTITHIAYANSADGTDGFTTVYPNLNLLDGTKDFSGTWTNSSSWVTNGTYKGLTVKTQNVAWTAIAKKFTVLTSGTYTISEYVRNTGSTQAKSYFNVNGNTVDQINNGTNFDWKRVSLTRTLSAGDVVTLDTHNGTTGQISIAGYKVENSLTSTPYMPSSTEVTTADWPKYIGFSNIIKPNKTSSDYKWLPIDSAANDAQLLRYAADKSVTRTDGVVLFDKDGIANGTINGKAFINVKNNWAVSYRKLGNRVQLRVISCDGITKDSATIATLPQEARPDQIIYSQAGRNVTRGAIEFFAISSNGDIYYQSGQYDPALTDKHDLVVEYTV